MNITDRRRILGPSNAKPLIFEKPESSEQEVQQPQEKSNVENESMYIKNGLVSNANGSSYLELKNGELSEQCTILLTSVYGPRPSRGAFSSKASLSVQFKEVTIEKIPSGELKEICNFLSNIFSAVINLERYPKSGIDIFLSLVQNPTTSDEGNLQPIIAACVNGITLALADAGIEIFDTVSAGTYKRNVVAFSKNGTEVVGLWKDKEDDTENNILNVIESCKESYLKNRKVIIEYLIRSRDADI
ncbi:LAQU0S01e12816g1_1 [Lachancea quebecensis]|uniref:LAQU0S01e12816g1_1 n=1 Tax=Lachancea quebecensis TaxID=1654605 RepID=A0A0P1KMR8_9SACH|nr:LAQU0S01e12816g1_1 [Lachancea quebecensis]